MTPSINNTLSTAKSPPKPSSFIREHQTDDVRALALQARKYPTGRYADRHHTDSRKASCRRKDSIMERYG